MGRGRVRERERDFNSLLTNLAFFKIVVPSLYKNNISLTKLYMFQSLTATCTQRIQVCLAIQAGILRSARNVSAWRCVGPSSCVY